MQTSYSRITATLLTVLTVGCATVTTPSMPEPPSTVRTSSPRTSTSSETRRWRINPTSESQSYSSTTKTFVHLISDSSQINDSIISTTTLSIALNRSSDTLITIVGTINSFTLAAGKRIGLPEQSANYPAAFTGQISNRQISLDFTTLQKTSTPCNSPASSVLAAVHRTLLILPLEILAETTWTDSTHTTGCQGNIPLFTTATNTYRVVGETSHQAKKTILIERTTKIVFKGEGSQNQHRILIGGEGSSNGIIYADPTTGLLITAETDQSSTLFITMSGQKQTFTQKTKEKILLTSY